MSLSDRSGIAERLSDAAPAHEAPPPPPVGEPELSRSPLAPPPTPTSTSTQKPQQRSRDGSLSANKSSRHATGQPQSQSRSPSQRAGVTRRIASAHDAVALAAYTQAEEVSPPVEPLPLNDLPQGTAVRDDLPEELPRQRPPAMAPIEPAPIEPAPIERQPGSDGWLRLPPAGAGQDSVKISTADDLISLTARDAPLSSVLALIAEQHGLNVVTGADVNEQISVSITDAHLEDVLDAILATNGYAWTRNKNIIIVSKISNETKSSPVVQGRSVEVFSLNYVSATDVEKVVQGLISPVGQVFTTQSMPTDHRRTQEQLVVEDMPEYLQRIAQYVAQADTPPRQVQLEAHVLQVTLKDNCRHGVNFQEILHVANSDVTFSTVGLASATAPTSMLRLDGADLDSLLEALKSTTDAKTLASPKVTVLNNQEARMQVGGKIGYLLSTTTQTSTLQSVNFLDVGVILSVLPSITADGQVVVRVSPEVSTGRINPTTQLPESETTQVETQVLLADGEAIVIGGLIKESDVDNRNKVPILGDLWVVGWLFQRRETSRERNEIIITLVPRIVPDARDWQCLDGDDIQQAQTPLLYGPLDRVDRTRFEPEFPCYSVRPRHRKAYAPPPRGRSSVEAPMPVYRSSASPEMFDSSFVSEAPVVRGSSMPLPP